MNNNLSFHLLLKTWLPIVLGFVFFRLMAIIDLAMIAPFGSEYVAGFGVPTKIMLLDMLAAFSLGPIASIMMARTQSMEERAQSAGQIISASTAIAFVVMGIGLFLYPIILKSIVVNTKILNAASLILFWFTLAIPFRLLHFVQSMIHHGLGKGRIVLVIDAIALILNAPVNYLLMQLVGVSGVFIGTFILSGLTSVLLFLSLRTQLHVTLVHLYSFDLDILKQFLRHARDEFVRLCLLFGHSFSIIAVLGRVTTTAPHILTAFSASSEVGQLFLMVFIAVMRSVAIISAPMNAPMKILAVDWFHSMKRCLFLALALSALIAAFTDLIGQRFYYFDQATLRWWNMYMIHFSIALPIVSINAFFRGLLQSRKHFSTTTKIEIFSKWIVAWPIFFIGFKLGSPFIAYSFVLVSELVELLVYVRVVLYRPMEFSHAPKMRT